jgi:tight adherence protein B
MSASLWSVMPTATAIVLMPRRMARARWHRVLAAAAKPRPPRPGLVVRAGKGIMAIPGLAVATAAIGVGVVGLALAGPVAGGVLAVYGGAGAAMALRRAGQRARAAADIVAVDAVAALAAEVRAGLSVETALAVAGSSLLRAEAVGPTAAVVARRLAAAVDVAATTGAPLADVLDRLDTHLRSVDRARASASAQAAGTRASAMILAVMPGTGVGLGYAMGVDPLRVLLHTPLGAACAAGCLMLQFAGLAWSARLGRVEVPS